MRSRIAAAAFVAAMALATFAVLARAAFPFRGGDEQGHFSYLVHLVKTQLWWPNLVEMPIYDLGGAPTASLNFINHPPLFYWLLEPAYQVIQALGADPSWLRAFTLVFSFAAYAVIAGLLVRMRFGVLAFAAVLGAMLFLQAPTFAAFFNNDQMALLGGALACYGAARRIESGDDRAGLALILAGVALCSVKLTALMLVGGFSAIALAGGRGRGVDRQGLGALVLVGLFASAPYLALWAEYGSPAPDTPGQTAMLRGYIAEFGWDKVPHVGLFDYVITTPSLFAVQMGQGVGPLLGLALLVFAQLTAFRDAKDGKEAAAAAVVRAAALATAIMLPIHVMFAHRRYEALGWLGDLYPRYYFPLLGAYALGWALFAERLGREALVLWTRADSAIRPQISASRQG